MNQKVEVQVLQQLLEGLDLNEVEARVLIASLQVGARPASLIAKRAKIKRAHCYQILEGLLARGFVQEFIKNNVKHFVGVQPQTLLEISEKIAVKAIEAKKQLEAALPLFAALQGKFFVPPKVRYFYGFEGIVQVLEDSLKVPSHPIYAVADDAFLHSSKSPELANYMKNIYIPNRVKRNCSYYGIVCHSPGPKGDRSIREFWTSKKLKRECRLLDGVNLAIELICYGNTVAILSLVGEMYAIRIDDERLATSFREIHGIAWPLLPLLKA